MSRVTPPRWFPSVLLAATLASGCLPLPTRVGGLLGEAGKEGTVVAQSDGKVFKPGETLPNAGGNPAGGGIISNNSGTLFGVVRVPNGILSNNGGGIISNNGGNIIANNSGTIIANNSGNYCLMAVPEHSTLGRVTVALLDAGGKAVVGPDGQPLTTVTDDMGRYAFTAALPAKNLVLKVVLPQNKGALTAIAPRGDGNRPVDLDLVSTLVTDYILEKYVKGQDDPVAILEKLPPAVEADTRAKAAAAKGLALPDDMTTGKVVAAVERMRREDGAFDAQMEDVKALLLGAGQSDLGNGRPATEVPLRSLNAMLVAPDGMLYMCDWDSRRIWRLRPDGIIETVAGVGAPSAASLQGVAGPQAGLFALQGLALDAQGRLLILERAFDEDDAYQGTATNARLSRLEKDGKLTELWANLKPSLAAVPTAQGEVRVVTNGNAGAPSEVWLLKADGTRQLEATLSGADSAAIANSAGYGQDAQGRIYLRKSDGIMCYDPAGKSVSAVGSLGDDGPQQDFFRKALDPTGNYFFKRQAEQTLTWRKPDGTVASVPNASLKGFLMAATAAADGTVYYADFAGSTIQVFKLPKGAAQPTQVAGLATAAGDGKNALALALQMPGGVAFTAQGDAMIADSKANTITRLVGQTATPFAGTGNGARSGDGGPALQAGIAMPTKLQMDAQGNLYVLEGSAFPKGAIRKVAPDGTITTYGSTNGAALMWTDMAVAPDGTVYVAMVEQSGKRTVWTFAAGGGQGQVLYQNDVSEIAYGSNRLFLALGADGALTILDKQKLMRWSKAGGVVELVSDSRFGVGAPFYGTSIAVDGKGRVYVANSGANTVSQYDPASGAFKVIAGPNGLFANGATVDNSLDGPAFPALDAQGNLYISDTGHGQVKIIKAGAF